MSGTDSAEYVREVVSQQELTAAAKDAKLLSNQDLVRVTIGGAATVGCFYGAIPGMCEGPRKALHVLEEEVLRRLSAL